MRYIIVTETISEFCGEKWLRMFCDNVNDSLAEGFLPLGAPFISGDYINQALWKPARQKNKAPIKQPTTAETSEGG